MYLIVHRFYSMSDPDPGFCSGEEEIEGDDDLHSPTDVSQDSLEVQVLPIRLQNTPNKNKRKCAEPRKLSSEGDLPLKKAKISLSSPLSSPSPFRPWSLSEVNTKQPQTLIQEGFNTNIPSILVEQGWLHTHPRLQSSPESQTSLTLPSLCSSFAPQEEQDQPLALVLRPSRAKEAASIDKRDKDPGDPGTSMLSEKGNYFSSPSLAKQLSPKGRVQESYSKSKSNRCKKQTFPKFTVDCLLKEENALTNKDAQLFPPPQPRNYKNMTRERRIEANARERTRVHTISAAFDTLRRAVPSYSNTQKLSKLSVLRIACSYMMMLSQLVDQDLSPDEDQTTLASCVDQIAHTIQNEGKLRKKKDD